ncbi:MAG TPA: hypothetical protein VGY77_11925 [Gemmataceae bacterium]|jgi:hypothetical protein|nr:hypothetical protein [Gemmataceae bacterium]
MAVSRTRDRETERTVAPRSDAYTGLLAISLGALVVSCVFLFLDFNQYETTKKPTVPPVPRIEKPVPAEGAPVPPPGGPPGMG